MYERRKCIYFCVYLSRWFPPSWRALDHDFSVLCGLDLFSVEYDGRLGGDCDRQDGILRSDWSHPFSRSHLALVDSVVFQIHRHDVQSEVTCNLIKLSKIILNYPSCTLVNFIPGKKWLVCLKSQDVGAVISTKYFTYCRFSLHILLKWLALFELPFHLKDVLPPTI